MKSAMRSLGVIFCAVAIAASGASARIVTPPIPSDSEILQLLTVRVDLQRHGTGVVIGIAQPSGHRIVAYGTLGLVDKRPMNCDTAFDIASITKIFTAL